MFVNAPERMKLNSRGTGITSGLVPVMKAKKGYFADSEEYKKLYELAQQITPEQKGFFSRQSYWKMSSSILEFGFYLLITPL